MRSLIDWSRIVLPAAWGCSQAEPPLFSFRILTRSLRLLPAAIHGFAEVGGGRGGRFPGRRAASLPACSAGRPCHCRRSSSCSRCRRRLSACCRHFRSCCRRRSGAGRHGGGRRGGSGDPALGYRGAAQDGSPQGRHLVRKKEGMAKGVGGCLRAPFGDRCGRCLPERLLAREAAALLCPSCPLLVHGRLLRIPGADFRAPFFPPPAPMTGFASAPCRHGSNSSPPGRQRWPLPPGIFSHCFKWWLATRPRRKNGANEYFGQGFSFPEQLPW